MNLQDILKRLQLQRQNPNGVGQNTGPFYTEPGLASVGGSVQLPFGLPQVGGTLGVDNGRAFGNMNVNHNPVAAFGPGDSNLVDNGGRPQVPAGWDATTYNNFKRANPNLEPDAQDTRIMQGTEQAPGVARQAMPMMQSQQPMMANPQNISNMNSPVANSSAVMTLMNLLKQRGL
jgi:hypothetical protein